MIRKVLARLFVGLAAALSSLEPASDVRGDAFLRQHVSAGLERGYPGVAVIVGDQFGCTRAAAAGYADLENRLRLRATDRFHIGSITKTFTAAAVLRLVDAGALHLNDTLSSLLGDAVAHIPHADRITLAQLLDHSSGIYATNNDVDYLSELVGERANPTRIWSFAYFVGLADGRRREPAHPPGEGHSYSDTNYHLLGMIVERASGQSFKTYIKAAIFRPLGMDSTSFLSDEIFADRPPHQGVQGYMLETPDIRDVVAVNAMFRPVSGFPVRNGERLLNTTLAAERADAAGGILSTLPDLMRFARALFDGELLTPESQTFLMQAAEGMGEIEIGQHRTRTLQALRKPWGMMIYKEGDGAGGTTALMAYLPSTRRIYIGFVNRFGGSFDHVDFLMDEVIGPSEARWAPTEGVAADAMRDEQGCTG